MTGRILCRLGNLPGLARLHDWKAVGNGHYWGFDQCKRCDKTRAVTGGRI